MAMIKETYKTAHVKNAYDIEKQVTPNELTDMGQIKPTQDEVVVLKTCTGCLFCAFNADVHLRYLETKKKIPK